jgi:hypothetical protein
MRYQHQETTENDAQPRLIDQHHKSTRVIAMLAQDCYEDIQQFTGGIVRHVSPKHYRPHTRRKIDPRVNFCAREYEKQTKTRAGARVSGTPAPAAGERTWPKPNRIPAGPRQRRRHGHGHHCQIM